MVIPFNGVMGMDWKQTPWSFGADENFLSLYLRDGSFLTKFMVPCTEDWCSLICELYVRHLSCPPTKEKLVGESHSFSVHVTMRIRSYLECLLECKCSSHFLFGLRRPHVWLQYMNQKKGVVTSLLWEAAPHSVAPTFLLTERQIHTVRWGSFSFSRAQRALQPPASSYLSRR